MHSAYRFLASRTRAWLAAAACLLALGVSPASQAGGTYVVVLKDPYLAPRTGSDHAQISNPDGVFGIPEPGFGGYVDSGFITAPRVTPEQLEAQFGPALAAMRTILEQGLPPLPHSYLVLLAPESGSPGSLQVQVRGRAYGLDAPGRAMLIDGYSYDPFTPDKRQLDADFGPVLATLAEARAAGLPVRSYVVLLENPDGRVGAIMVTGATGVTTLDRNGQAVGLDGAAAQVFQADPAQVQQDFGSALAARPPLPAHVTLFFENGSTKLTPDSQRILDQLLADLRGRPLPEMRLEGHTDSVGRDRYNDKLARERADYVAGRVAEAIDLKGYLEVEAFGARQLLVATPPQTAEPRNRRVEVFIR